jgi:small subunit ribosomal protein S20
LTRPGACAKSRTSRNETIVANHKSAEKRNRQRVKRRARNLNHLSPMRTYMKRVRRALGNDDVETAQKTLPQAITAIAKAASKGVIHRNTASRYVSRLTRAVTAAGKSD